MFRSGRNCLLLGREGGETSAFHCTHGEMYNMLNAFSMKLMAVVDGKFGGVEDSGRSQDCVTGGDTFGYVLETQDGASEVGETHEGEDSLSGIFIPQASGSDPEALGNSGFEQTIMDLAAIFHGGDEVDLAFPESLAKAVNETMR